MYVCALSYAHEIRRDGVGGTVVVGRPPQQHNRGGLRSCLVGEGMSE